MGIDYYNKVIFIEPDVFYSPDKAAETLLKSKEYDILSGYSCLFPEFDIYDTWATRLNMEMFPLDIQNIDRFHKHQEKMREYFNNSKESMIKMTSTFSGFCIYNPDIFANDIFFSATRDGIYDCDTTLICYSAIDAGFKQIYLYRDFVIYHYK